MIVDNQLPHHAYDGEADQTLEPAKRVDGGLDSGLHTRLADHFGAHEARILANRAGQNAAARASDSLDLNASSARETVPRGRCRSPTGRPCASRDSLVATRHSPLATRHSPQ